MIFLSSKAVAASAVFIVLATGGPVLAQENATKFIQGDQTYEARVIPERIALVLSDEALENEESYNSFRDKLKGEQIPGQSPRILVIAASNNHNAASLAEQARELQRSNAGVVQDSGFLVLLGSAETPSVVTDRIVVKLAPGIDINKIAEEQQIELLASDPFDETQFVLKVPSKNSRDSLSISNDINLIPGVAYAKPDFYSPVRPRQPPNDPLFGKQWHLENMGASGGTMDADIDGARAWHLGSGGHPGVVIAVIDGGIAVEHPDLDYNIRVNTAEYPPDKKDSDRNKLVDDYMGWDFIPCNTSSFPCGDNNVRPNFHEKHGTPVAGAAAAETDNLVGVAGVCGDCKILPIRALDASDFALAKAFDYARTNGADVITASWGLVPGYPLPLDVVNAINMAAEKGRNGLGAVVLFAMTDTPTENCSGMFPDISSLPKVIAVSASTNQDRIAGTGYGSCMDVLAPTAGGTLGAASTDFPGEYGYNYRSPDALCMTSELSTLQLDYTVCFNGTSFATPVVAGLAGLILSHQPLLLRVQVQRLLQDTADKISPTDGAYIAETGFSAQTTQPAPTHGFGRVNAFEAVREVASSASGGRDGVDIYLRDNRLDWGNTEQPSNITLEQVRGFIPHWESPDIKVDAPPYSSPPATSTDFNLMADEQPLANSVNRVFVRVHNRGPSDASGVTVKLHWAFAGEGLPNLPNNDFWPSFPADAADVAAWRPIASQVLPSVPYSGASVAGGAWDESKIVQFEFNAPGLDTSRSSPDLFTLLAILDAPADPISSASRGSLVPDVFTPRDNNIAQKQIRLVDSGQMFSQTILLTNPFSYPIRTRLVANAPEVEAGDGSAVDLKPGETRSIDVIVRGGGAAGRSIDLMQLYQSPGSVQEHLLGGRSYQIEPARSPLDAERHDPMDRR